MQRMNTAPELHLSSGAEMVARADHTLEDLGARRRFFFACLSYDARSLERDVGRHTFSRTRVAKEAPPRASLARLREPADMRAGCSGPLSGALLFTVVLLTEALDLFRPPGTVISASLVT